MKLFAVLPVMMLFALYSCSKDNNDSGGGQDSLSVITITLPVASTVYTNGSTLRVEGEITDINTLATVKVEIRNKTTGAIYYQQSNPTGNVSFFRFAWNWPITGITTSTPATIKVIATDKLSNQVTKEVDVILDN